MPCSESLNCAVVGAAQGEHTLQEIGDIFNVTRMRICQIEKTILADLSIMRNVKMTR
jgi:DNA-directed RNA polymerase sigma subunit (sigma70/sigma32)